MPHDPNGDAPAAADPLVTGAGAVFAEPWQARAFALAIVASQQGCFTWPEWTGALSRELRGAGDAHYFDCWLSALQSLLVGKDLIGQVELAARKTAWEDAYRRTPHGAPVSLPAGR